MSKDRAATYLVIPWFPSRQDCTLDRFHSHQLHSRLLLLQVSSRAHDGAPSAHACTIPKMQLEGDFGHIAAADRTPCQDELVRRCHSSLQKQPRGAFGIVLCLLLWRCSAVTLPCYNATEGGTAQKAPATRMSIVPAVSRQISGPVVA